MLTSEKIMKKKHRDNNYFKKPVSAQDIIPIDAAYPDGMFLSNGKLYSRSFRISDINYSGQSEEQQESVIRRLRAAIRGCTAGEISQFTIINRRQNEDSITRLFYPTDDCDNRDLRNELNEVIRSKSGRGTGLIQELFFTASVDRPTPKAASLYFEQIDSEIGAQFGSLGSSFTSMSLSERLRLLHDFYRPGDENYWQFDLADKQKKGHSVKDSIAPMSIKFLPDRFEMGGKFGRVLAMTDYAGNIDDRTLAKLSMLDMEMVISVSFMPVPSEEAKQHLDVKLDTVKSNANQRLSKQMNKQKFISGVSRSISEQQKNIEELQKDLSERDCTLVIATVTVCHLADTMEQLNSDTEQIRTTARTVSCDFNTCRDQQLNALNTNLPFALDRIQIDRSMTNESLATFVPFKSQEISDRNGILYGQNSITKNLVLIDKLSRDSGNAFILGMTGGGKSFFTKYEMISLKLRYPNADFLILDPESEYTNLTHALGGEVYHIGRDGLNLFDLEIDPAEKNPLTYKTEFIISCCEQIVGGMLDAQSKSIIDRAVRMIYRSFLKSHDKKDIPIISDLRAALDKMHDDRAHELSLALEMFTEGYLSTFNEPTQIQTDNSMLCFSLSGLQDNVRSLGMLITLDHILNRVMENLRTGRTTFVYADEFAFLLQDEETAAFFAELWRRIRKYNGFCTGICQNVEDILKSATGKSMIENSEFVIMLKQAAINAAALANMYHISPNQMQYFTNAEPGQGLIKIGGVLVPFDSRIPKGTKLYELCNTDRGGNWQKKGNK